MVAFSNLIVALAATAMTVEAAPIDKHNFEKRAGGCSSYVIINTRGTGEMQGQSSGFRKMNSAVMSKKSGGSIYNTVYSAGITQMSAKGTADIVRKVSSTLSSNPNTCFILEGYSQGAAATTNALPKLTGANFEAVKGVFLIGNPMHHKGKACNVDTKGGKTTMNVNGMSAALGGIPENWVSKTMDVCNYGDGVCDTSHGFGINMQHLAYPASASTQSMGQEFILKQLNGAGAATASAEADCTEEAPAADSSAADTLAADTLAADATTATGTGSTAGTAYPSDTASSSKSKRQFGGLGKMGGGGGGSSRLDKLKSMFGGGASGSSQSSGSASTEASGSTESSGTAAKACTKPAAAITGGSDTASTGADASADTSADASADTGADASGGSRLDKLKSMFGGGGSGGGMGGLSKLRGMGGGSGGGMGGLSKLRGMGGA